MGCVRDRRNRSVHIWDMAKREEHFAATGSEGGLWHVAISLDGKRVATGGMDETVRLWDTSTGNELLRLIKPKEYIKQLTFQMQPGNRLQFAADGKMVMLSQGYHLSWWRTDTGMQVQRREYGGVSLLPTPDGRFVVERESKGDFYLLDAATGKKLRAFKAPHSRFTAASTAAISPDGKFLAANSALENGIIAIWELATGKERCSCKGAPHLANALAFSHDGKHLAGSTMAVDTYQAENSIYLWDAATGRTVRQFRTSGHYVTCLDISSDGRTLVSGGGDKTIRLWETATGKERLCFRGHQGIVHSVAVSSDGTRIVSASDDTTALVWDATASTFAENPTDKQLQAAWSDLASDDAAKAYRAIWLLARYPKQSVPLLRNKVPPARAADAETRKQIEQRLADLDSDEAAVREGASTELEKRVVMAEPLLRKALTGRPSLEQRKRIERVLERLEQEQLALGRALEALEHVHAPEARQLLETLAAGEPGAWLTQEAKAALQSKSEPRP